jgi:hypothetical protein
MAVKVQDTEVLREILDRWKAGIDAQAPERVAEVVKCAEDGRRIVHYQASELD